MPIQSTQHNTTMNNPRGSTRIRVLGAVMASVAAVAASIAGLQFGLSTAFASGDVCDLCSTNYDPVACCSSGGSAYDSNPGGGIDVSAQKAAFDSYCANYKKQQSGAGKTGSGAAAGSSAGGKGSTNTTGSSASSKSQSNNTAQGSSSGSGTGQSGTTTSQGTTSGRQSQNSSGSTQQSNAANQNATNTGQNKQSDSEASESPSENSSSSSAPSSQASDNPEDSNAADNVTAQSETSAAGQPTHTDGNPALRIGAGVTIALAIACTIIAAVLLKRKRRSKAQDFTGDLRDDDGLIDADDAAAAGAVNFDAPSFEVPRLDELPNERTAVLPAPTTRAESARPTPADDTLPTRDFHTQQTPEEPEEGNQQ